MGKDIPVVGVAVPSNGREGVDVNVGPNPQSSKLEEKNKSPTVRVEQIVIPELPLNSSPDLASSSSPKSEPSSPLDNAPPDTLLRSQSERPGGFFGKHKKSALGGSARRKLDLDVSTDSVGSVDSAVGAVPPLGVLGSINTRSHDGFPLDSPRLPVYPDWLLEFSLQVDRREDGRKGYGKGGKKIIAAYEALRKKMESSPNKKRILSDEIRSYLGDRKKRIENNGKYNDRDIAVVFGIKLLDHGVREVKIEGTDLGDDLVNPSISAEWDKALISAAKVGGGDKTNANGTLRNSRFEMFGDQHVIQCFASFIMTAVEKNVAKEAPRYTAEAARAVVLHATVESDIFRALRWRTDYCGIGESGASIIDAIRRATVGRGAISARGEGGEGKYLGLEFVSDAVRLLLRDDLQAAEVKDFCTGFIYKVFTDAIAKKIPLTGFLAAESVKTVLLSLSEAWQTALKKSVAAMFNDAICSDNSFAEVEKLLAMPAEDILSWLGKSYVPSLLDTAISRGADLCLEQLLNVTADMDGTALQRKLGYWLLCVAVVSKGEDTHGDHLDLPVNGVFGGAVKFLNSMLAIDGSIAEEYLNQMPDKCLCDFKFYTDDPKLDISGEIKEFFKQLIRNRLFKSAVIGYAKFVERAKVFMLKDEAALHAELREFTKEERKVLFEAAVQRRDSDFLALFNHCYPTIEDLKDSVGMDEATADQAYWLMACACVNRRLPQYVMAADYLARIQSLDPSKFPVDNLNNSALLGILKDTSTTDDNGTVYPQVQSFCVERIRVRINGIVNEESPDIVFLKQCEDHAGVLVEGSLNDRVLAKTYWLLACSYAKLEKKWYGKGKYIADVIRCLKQVPLSESSWDVGVLDPRQMDIEVWCRVLNQIGSDEQQGFCRKFSEQYDSFVRSTLPIGGAVNYVQLSRFVEFAAKAGFSSTTIQGANWVLACKEICNESADPEDILTYTSRVTDEYLNGTVGIDESVAVLALHKVSKDKDTSEGWYKVVEKARILGKLAELKRFADKIPRFASVYQFYEDDFSSKIQDPGKHEEAVKCLSCLMRNASLNQICTVVQWMWASPVALFFPSSVRFDRERSGVCVRYWQEAIKSLKSRKFEAVTGDDPAETRKLRDRLMQYLSIMRGCVMLCDPLFVCSSNGSWEQELDKEYKVGERLLLIGRLMKVVHGEDPAYGETQKQVVVTKVCKYFAKNLDVLKIALENAHNQCKFLFECGCMQVLFGNEQMRFQVTASSELRDSFYRSIQQQRQHGSFLDFAKQICWFLAGAENDPVRAANYFVSATDQSIRGELSDDVLGKMSNQTLGQILRELLVRIRGDNAGWEEGFKVCFEFIKSRINHDFNLVNFRPRCTEFGVSISEAMVQFLSAENFRTLFLQANEAHDFEILAAVVASHDRYSNKIPAGAVNQDDVENARWQLACHYAESEQIDGQVRARDYCRYLSVNLLELDGLNQMSLQGWCHILQVLDSEESDSFFRKFSTAQDLQKFKVFYVGKFLVSLNASEIARSTVEFLPEFIKVAALDKIKSVIEDIYSWLMKSPIVEGMIPHFLPRDLNGKLNEAMTAIEARMKGCKNRSLKDPKNARDLKVLEGLSGLLAIIKNHGALCDPEHIACISKSSSLRQQYFADMGKVREDLRMRFIRNLWDLAHTEMYSVPQQAAVENILCTYVSQELAQEAANPVTTDLSRGIGVTLFPQGFAAALLKTPFVSLAVNRFAELISVGGVNVFQNLVAPDQKDAICKSYERFFERAGVTDVGFRRDIKLMLGLTCFADQVLQRELKTKLCTALCTHIQSQNITLLDVDHLQLVLSNLSPAAAEATVEFLNAKDEVFFKQTVIPAVLALSSGDNVGNGDGIFSSLCLAIYSKTALFERLSSASKEQIYKGINLSSLLDNLKRQSKNSGGKEKIKAFFNDFGKERLRELLNDQNLANKCDKLVDELSMEDISHEILPFSRSLIFGRWMNLHCKKTNGLQTIGEALKQINVPLHELFTMVQYVDENNRVLVLKAIMPRINFINLTGADFVFLTTLWRACVSRAGEIQPFPVPLLVEDTDAARQSARDQVRDQIFTAALLCGDPRAARLVLNLQFKEDDTQKSMDDFFARMGKVVADDYKVIQSVKLSDVASAYAGIGLWREHVSSRVPIELVNLSWNGLKDASIGENEVRIVRTGWLFHKWSVVYKNRTTKRIVHSSLKDFCRYKDESEQEVRMGNWNNDYQVVLSWCEREVKSLEKRDQRNGEAFARSAVMPADQVNGSYAADDDIKGFVLQRLMPDLPINSRTAPKLFTRTILTANNLLAREFKEMVKQTSRSPARSQVVPAGVSAEEQSLYRTLSHIGANLVDLVKDVNFVHLSKTAKSILLNKRLYAVCSAEQRPAVAAAAKTILEKNRVWFAGSRLWWHQWRSESYANNHLEAMRNVREVAASALGTGGSSPRSVPGGNGYPDIMSAIHHSEVPQSVVSAAARHQEDISDTHGSAVGLDEGVLPSMPPPMPQVS